MLSSRRNGAAVADSLCAIFLRVVSSWAGVRTIWHAPNTSGQASEMRRVVRELSKREISNMSYSSRKLSDHGEGFAPSKCNQASGKP